MSTDTQKYRNFISEPMGGKNVTELPGIGSAYGAILCANGFDTADTVLGQFLVLKRNEEMFKAWLHSVCGANSRYQEYCYNGLNSWCNSYIW